MLSYFRDVREFISDSNVGVRMEPGSQLSAKLAEMKGTDSVTDA